MARSNPTRAASSRVCGRRSVSISRARPGRKIRASRRAPHHSPCDAWCSRGDWPKLPAALPLQHLPLERSSLEPPEFSWVGETQRHVGTVVHALLAGAATPPPARDAETQHARVLEQLRLHGVSRQTSAPGPRNSCCRRWPAHCEDARGRWILDSSHRDASCELALTGLAAGRLRSVVIDRCFVDADGTRWVIDYKSSRHEGGRLEGFLDQEMQRYRSAAHDLRGSRARARAAAGARRAVLSALGLIPRAAQES